MRKKPTMEGRPPRHDELVAELLTHAEAFVAHIGAEWSALPEPQVHVEFARRRGHIDVLFRWAVRCAVPVRFRPYPSSQHEKTEPCGTAFIRELIVEVKSEHEKWTAGDLLRQMSAYVERDQLACEHMPDVKSLLVLYSGRDLTVPERVILEHAGVCVVVAGAPGGF